MRAWGAQHDRDSGESADPGEYSEVPVNGNRGLAGGAPFKRQTRVLSKAYHQEVC